ncbi:hypothetical protein K435DRAFT_802451 [Dendrothele bispora CBS 962.96]|uniref:Uncharacterized protein n=1 Tax=Dendrothele bispora (strain CBS 962.96) TaxID=1314807 RepID=A0A4S8LKS8_DENBC|nr:hypothetical protein K435DRAFT_802451 [Dendrothele bispora CBS 962.96]
MADLHNKLEQVLQGCYQATDWNAAINLATDKDRDTAKAAEQVQSITPSHVLFSGFESTIPEIIAKELEADGKDHGEDQTDELDESEYPKDVQKGGEDEMEQVDTGDQMEICYNEEEDITVWNNPGHIFWPPWVKTSLHRWKTGLEEKDISLSELWVSVFEELIDSLNTTDAVRIRKGVPDQK